MSEMQGRGYLVTSAAEFLKKRLGDGGWESARRGLSSELVGALDKGLKPAGWYPIGYYNEMTNSVIQTVGKGDGEAGKRALFELGNYTASTASNSFLKIFLKILTPSLFAKKLPELFRRDFTSGRLEVELSDGSISGRMFDMPDFENGAPLCPGFASFPLETMGKKIGKLTVRDWSLTSRGVDGAGFELTWSD